MSPESRAGYFIRNHKYPPKEMKIERETYEIKILLPFFIFMYFKLFPITKIKKKVTRV